MRTLVAVAHALAFASFASFASVPAWSQQPGQPPAQPAQPAPEPLHAVPPTARDSTPAPRVGRDTTVIPALDRGRAVDAEVRSALFDLMTGHPVASLNRLRRLDPQMEPVQRHFLVAECYYRLGMDDSLRAEAATLLALPEGARFGPLLRAQLLMADYRDGDYARAVEQAKALAPSEQNGVNALLAGLAAYRLGDQPTARTSLLAAQGTAGPYATYAQFMLTMMALKADTAHGGPAAVAALDGLLPSQGPTADQVHLALAQLAYEGGQYDRAITESGQVSKQGGLRAPALLTGAWALFRAGRTQPAADSFAEYARDYPELPARDEGRLMYAQASLQLHHDDDATIAFHAVGDSVADEEQRLGPGGAGLRGGGRLLVNARVADVLLLGDVAGGKALTFPESAGAGVDVLKVAVNDVAAMPPPVSPPTIVSADDLSHRLDAAGIDSAGVAQAQVAAGAPLLRRAVFMPPSDATSREELARGLSTLRDADVSVGVAAYAVRTESGEVTLEVANLKRLREIIATSQDSLGTGFGPLAASEDSLSKVTTGVDSANTRLHRLFATQVSELRDLTRENGVGLDSVKQSLSGAMDTADVAYFQREHETADTYRRIADVVERGLDSAILRNPAFALRDTVRQRGERTRALIVQTRAAIAAAGAAVDSEAARVGRGESDRRAGYRAVLAAAQAHRDVAAAALVATVDKELAARAVAMAANMRHNQEAAEFGSATASFFRAVHVDSSATPAAAAQRPPGSGRRERAP